MCNALWVFDNRHRQRGRTPVAGVDEAGRGPLAGPVVAAAVILPDDFRPSGIDDSKRIRPSRRARLERVIAAGALAIGVGLVEAAEIDRINIREASRMAMAIAVANLARPARHLLIDGNLPICSPVAQTTVVGGDRRSLSIAAASIVAKETRDRLMRIHDRRFPQFGFARHKGYPTRQHKQALALHGRCPLHRCSFAGVRETA